MSERDDEDEEDRSEDCHRDNVDESHMLRTVEPIDEEEMIDQIILRNEL